MPYSFTERKRIRKNSGGRDSVLKVPYIVQKKKGAYTAFMQTKKKKKKVTHFQEVVSS